MEQRDGKEQAPGRWRQQPGDAQFLARQPCEQHRNQTQTIGDQQFVAADRQFAQIEQPIDGRHQRRYVKHPALAAGAR